MTACVWVSTLRDDRWRVRKKNTAANEETGAQKRFTVKVKAVVKEEDEEQEMEEKQSCTAGHEKPSPLRGDVYLQWMWEKKKIVFFFFPSLFLKPSVRVMTMTTCVFCLVFSELCKWESSDLRNGESGCAEGSSDSESERRYTTQVCLKSA